MEEILLIPTCDSVDKNSLIKCSKDDSDEEIKDILEEINRISGLCPLNNHLQINEDEIKTDKDIEKILEKAQNLSEQAKEKYNLELEKNKKMAGSLSISAKPIQLQSPQRLVSEEKKNKKEGNSKKNTPKKSPLKESIQVPVKKVRPRSAGNVETKTKATQKATHLKSKDKLPVPKRKIRPLSASEADIKRKLSPIKKDNTKIATDKTTDVLLETLADENGKLKNGIIELKSTIDQHVDENTKLRLKIEEHETLIMKLGREYDRCKSCIESLKENEEKLIEELDKEKTDKENYMAIVAEEKVVTDDLKRQCQELDMALKRKHPDSVTALIVASKTNHMKDKKQILLEERIERLETELSEKEEHFRTVLQSLHTKFGEIKQKYEAHIIDIERQLMDDRKRMTDMRNKLTKTSCKDVCVLVKPNVETKTTQTNVRSDRSVSASKVTQNSALILSKLKEDSYLVATIRGLQNEIDVKDRKLGKVTKENDDLRKSVNLLKREKDVLLNVNTNNNLRCVVKSSKSLNTSLNKSINDLEAEVASIKADRDVIASERDTLARYIRSHLTP